MLQEIIAQLRGLRATTPAATGDRWVPVKVSTLGSLWVTLASSGGAEITIKSANVFKSALVTASGNTAVWTPASGKKFRLMGWRLSVAGTLAADGTQVLQLRDGTTTVIARAGANVAAALPANDTQIGEDYGFQGQLSAAANNVLNLNLGTAMASGAVYIDAWGTEE